MQNKKKEEHFMEQKIYLKKKLSMAIAVLGFFVLLVVSTTVHAATANPLAGMPTKVKTTVEGSEGAAYATPYYLSSEDLKITAVSSNPNVVKINGCRILYKMSAGVSMKYAWYGTYIQKPGTAKITVTVKLNGKTYKKTCAYTFVKYQNPFKSLKVGKQELTSELNKVAMTELKSGTSGTLKLVYKLKNGYKVQKVYYYPVYKQGKAYEPHNIKNGQNLPKKFDSIGFVIKNTKNNAIFNVRIGNIGNR